MIDRRRRRRRRLAVVIALLVALALLCARDRPLTIGTFNIRTFPGAATDPEAVARAIAELDADAFAVQEIIDLAAFDAVLARASALSGRRYRAALFPARCLRTTKEGMHVGVVHDARRLDRVAARLLGDPTCPPGQPAGMIAHLADVADEERALVLTSIHFTAGDAADRRAERAAQWRWLLRELPAIGARHDAPALVAGDFNSTGYLHAGDPERALIDALVEGHDRQLPTGSLACSMYWRRASGRYEVSLLDHVLAPRRLAIGEPEALGMCAQLACAPQEAEPAAYGAVSDHCPVRVVVDL